MSCYTLLSGFLLPWPPSNCLNVPTPFKEINDFYMPSLIAWSIPKHRICLPKTVHETRGSSPVMKTGSVCSKFATRSRAFAPGSSKHCSTTRDSYLVRYPRRNFGRNQLLDGSISLSPLFPSSMNELHVSITRVPYQRFRWFKLTQK